jgi:hypothetical protein
MKKFILMMIIAFSLAMLEADRSRITYKQPPPIVLRLESLPKYGRRKPMKRFSIYPV